MYHDVESAPVDAVADDEIVADGAKLLRVLHLLQVLEDEIPRTGLDDGARRRLAALMHGIVTDLDEALPPELEAEVSQLIGDMAAYENNERALRVLMAQLLGWVNGLLAPPATMPLRLVEPLA